jgi:hypothetical protein
MQAAMDADRLQRELEAIFGPPQVAAPDRDTGITVRCDCQLYSVCPGRCPSCRVTRMRAWMACCLIVAACGYPPLARLDGDANGAGGEGVPPDAQACFGSFDLEKICFSIVPSTPLTLSGDTPISTDDPAMCDPNNDRKGQYCVIAGVGFTLPAGKTIRAFGSKPLVLLSTTTIDLQGGVDVSSRNAGVMNTGAGANPAGSCTVTTAATGNSGGFGGSFSGRGGDGEPVDGSRGMAPAAASFPTILRGGCPGGSGATTSGTATAGVGGNGGGAVAIIAAVRIDFNDKINASGAGGLGGSPERSGAGGGGSGGMIVLDAPSIVPGASGQIFANGGGGAEGGAGTASGGTASMGLPGGESTAPKTPGTRGGGGAGGDGGDGGDGSAGSSLAGVNAGGTSQRDGGGGAGGGGAGFVYAPGVAAAMVAPPSTPPP